MKFAMVVLVGVLVGMAEGTMGASTVVDDPALDKMLVESRAEFFASQRKDARLQACIIVKESDGTWHRGSIDGTTTMYAASTVKLCYLAAAMHYAQENGKSVDWLDASIAPMIRVSSNEATGEVVDAITGAPNTDEGDLNAWIEKRRYTAKYLDARGLLGNQNAINKTYPSNSGEDPTKFEAKALKVVGRNALQPEMMAELMRRIAVGELEPQAREYMTGLLTHDRWSLQAPFGGSVPPGSVYYNKAGWISSGLHDVAYVKLPNGREFVLAAYSNLYSGGDPEPYTNAPLNGFFDLVLERSKLEQGDPQTLRLDNTSPSFFSTGAWTTETKDTDKHGEDYVYAEAGGAATAGWKIDVEKAGKYELCAWWPDGATRSAAAAMEVTSEGRVEKAKLMDERKSGGMWVLVGEFELAAGGNNSVVFDVSKSKAPGSVAVDAIRVRMIPNL